MHMSGCQRRRSVCLYRLRRRDRSPVGLVRIEIRWIGGRVAIHDSEGVGIVFMRLVFNYGNGEFHCVYAMGFRRRSLRRSYVLSGTLNCVRQKDPSKIFKLEIVLQVWRRWRSIVSGGIIAMHWGCQSPSNALYRPHASSCLLWFTVSKQFKACSGFRLANFGVDSSSSDSIR